MDCHTKNKTDAVLLVQKAAAISGVGAVKEVTTASGNNSDVGNDAHFDI